MTTKSPASRKSAERQRRKDAGEVRIECWVSERDGERLKEMAREADISVGCVVTQLLAYYYS